MELVTESPTRKVVPEGYKRNDFGLTPETWSVEKIGPKIDLLTGNPFSSSGYSDNGIRLLRCANIKRGNTDWSNDITKYWPDISPDLKKYKLQENDVVIAMDGSLVGRSYGILKEEDLPALLLQRAARVRSELIDTRYLKYFIGSDWFVRYCDSIKTNTAVPHISAEDIRNFEIPLPPTLEEQRAIAGALCDVDALIAALDALIQKKQQIKKGAMQKLLSGNKRLPSFSGAWEEKSLKELLKKFQNGNAFSAKGYVDNGVAIVTMAQIGLKGGFKFNANKVNRWPYEDYDSLSNYHLKNGDLIISMTDVTPDKNLIGRMAIVESNEKTLLNQRVGLLVVDEEKVNPFLLKTLSNMKEWREYCKSVASLGVQANISTKAIKNAKITIPSIEEQNAIAQILSDMDAEIQSLEAKRNKYQQIKQGMMQELLTGKTRLVKETIENVEADIQSEPNHNWEIDEAVLISVLADRFGNKEFPLGRFRRTKFSYLVRRFLESKVDQFLKKAAGPYNPKTRYSGPENIALNNGYVKNWKKGNRYGFIADENISQAQSYFKDWYGEEAISWLDEGFRFKNNDDLELLTTVDKSIVELREEGKAVSLANIKNVIASHPEWKAKLERELFSDENIEGAIKESLKLFK